MVLVTIEFNVDLIVSLNVWYHDGKTTHSLCQKENFLNQVNDVVPLKTFGQYEAIMAFSQKSKLHVNIPNALNEHFEEKNII